MKISGTQLRLAATDLTTHLACGHATQLDLRVAHGELKLPDFRDPHAKVRQELGLRHEKAYLKFLQENKQLDVVNLSSLDAENSQGLLADTLRHMEAGAQVIAQGALRSADEAWFGRPDVLLRVETPGKWDWSYEMQDTKLAKETKANTILQLLLYSELLTEVQGVAPEFVWVIPPRKDFAGEKYRAAEYAAYYRYVKKRLMKSVEAPLATYPEPVEHCDVCRWFRECDARRRGDDHLSLVAGMRRQQQEQLVVWDVPTVEKLAAMRVPIVERPRHGSRRGLETVREQARIQVEGRAEEKLKHEAIPCSEGNGLWRLPEPSGGDIFLDLEGDPFAGENGLEYLFGFTVRNATGRLEYQCKWALNPQEERIAFEWVVDEIQKRWAADPQMHIYHFTAREPSTLKRLMGLHATRENQVDCMLRAERFVDLHGVFKQSTRASVEQYALKELEAFYHFERATALEDARPAIRYIEHRLELGWGDQELSDSQREIVEGYNREDCLSTAAMQDWLEAERAERVKQGEAIERPEEKSGEPGEELKERLNYAEGLAQKLAEDIGDIPREQRSEEQSMKLLLSQLMSWHRRENKRAFQDKYRYIEATTEELLDEQVGLILLKHLQRTRPAKGNACAVDEYSFLQEKNSIRAGQDLYYGEEKFGTVDKIDHKAGTIEIRKTRKTENLDAEVLFAWKSPLGMEEHEASLCRIGEWIQANRLDGPGRYRAGRDLLLRRPPRLLGNEPLKQLASENQVTACTRIALALSDSLLAIQGPPGSGKTYTAARMIREMVRRGLKVGVTALSHQVIRKVLDDVVLAEVETGTTDAKCLHRTGDLEPSHRVNVSRGKSKETLNAIRSGEANVVGAVSWFWVAEEQFECVDVLVVDEAGQLSLADVLAVSQAGKKLILLGDPQQLERPTKGSHPEGADQSALEHMLNGEKTIPEELGFLLPISWRLHPRVCQFTSDYFYEGRLGSHDTTKNRVIQGHEWVKGGGLWFVSIEHEGNQNSSPEEVDAIVKIAKSLLAPSVTWSRGIEGQRPLALEDILVVAPYNAQVADLRDRLPGMRIGTVDKFQGQEAPVVIYSMTTSSAEDAPRGMEFLYSLNRFNVATSRAQTAVIVVGCSKLFEPECKSPRQMQLANALCGYREMATEIGAESI